MPLGVEDVPLAAVFYGWHGFDEDGCTGGRESSHWGGSPDGIGAVYRPEIGFYCSGAEETIAWQVEQMRAAGISVILYSWWGDSDLGADDPVADHVSATLFKLLDYLETNSVDMQVAVVVEPFDPELNKRETLDWLWDNVYAVYPERMLDWEGKPLLVTFETVLDDTGDDRWTYRRWTGGPLREGWHWSNNPQERTEDRISDDGVLVLMPRFDWWYWWIKGGPTPGVEEPVRRDPLLENGWYEEQWEVAEEHREGMRMLVIFAWNEYNEQAIIEPSFGGPAPVRGDYVEKTRRYYEEFLAASG